LQRLIVPVSSLALVFAIGIGWYWGVEGFTFLDAIYQAVITLSTVGYHEVQPLDNSGRIFTMVFIFAGLGLMFYTATTLVEVVVAGEIQETLGRRLTGRRVKRMQNHVIVCGYGRVGRSIAQELSDHGVDHIVVDQRREALDEATAVGSAVLLGDATEEPTLRAAHIERARSLVASSDSDVGNVYIVLTARALNPGLFIVARAGSETAEQRMTAAGADRAISPYQIAGRRMALSVVQPLMLDFVDVLAGRRTPDEKIMAELVLDADSQFAGQTVAQAFDPTLGLSLLGVIHESGGISVGPTGSEVLREGDRLMVYGTPQSLEGLNRRQHTG
jgi:voltage-gated potassium channel